MIPLIDVILILIIAGFVFYGFFFGLIRMIGSLLGLIIGAVLASRFYLLAYKYVEPYNFGYQNVVKVIVFFVLFSLISKLVSFAFVLLDKAFHLLTIIPFLKTFNKLGGVIFGFFSGSLTVGLMIFVSSKYAIIDTWFSSWLLGSKISPILLQMTKIILPLLPEFLKKIQGVV